MKFTIFGVLCIRTTKYFTTRLELFCFTEKLFFSIFFCFNIPIYVVKNAENNGESEFGGRILNL